jgi:hypothetical protein
MKCLATRELRVVLEFHVTNEAPFNLRVWDLGRVFFFDSSSMKVHLKAYNSEAHRISWFEGVTSYRILLLHHCRLGRSWMAGSLKT